MVCYGFHKQKQCFNGIYNWFNRDTKRRDWIWWDIHPSVGHQLSNPHGMTECLQLNYTPNWIAFVLFYAKNDKDVSWVMTQRGITQTKLMVQEKSQYGRYPWIRHVFVASTGSTHPQNIHPAELSLIVQHRLDAMTKKHMLNWLLLYEIWRGCTNKSDTEH